MRRLIKGLAQKEALAEKQKIMKKTAKKRRADFPAKLHQILLILLSSSIFLPITSTKVLTAYYQNTKRVIS